MSKFTETMYVVKDEERSLYYLWKNLYSRCERPQDSEYPQYGARGIRVSLEWDTFEKFRDSMGPRKSGRYRVQLIDSTKDFGPGNAEWKLK